MDSSSIALLQERFRQLQKVREKREEKELLKLFSEPDQHHAVVSTKVRHEPLSRFSSTFQAEVALPYRQPQQDSLALELNSGSRQADSRPKGIPGSSSLWRDSADSSSTSNYSENSDIDTSLRL